MNKPTYFKAWISKWEWGIKGALLLILISAMTQYGMFALSQNHLLSDMGAQPEDVSFAYLLTYVGIISILPVQFRFTRYFEIRSYLLINIMLSILLHIFCLNCSDMYLFFLLRFLQGIVVGNIAGCILILIFSRLRSERTQAVSAAVFFGTLLSNSVVIGLVTSLVVLSANFKQTYHYMIFFQLFTMLIALLILRPSSGHRRYPLYQIDWPGFVVFVFTAGAFCYTMIYGSKYYWFSDIRIICSVILTAGSLGLFIYRQKTAKRPLINLDVFKSSNFVVGLCLLAIYYGSKDSINLIYNYAGNILKWSPPQVMFLGCCNIVGLILSAVISTQLIIRNRKLIRPMIFTGFTVLVIQHLWIFFELTNDLAFNDLILPVSLQGFALGLLYIPIGVFVLSSVPGYTGTTGAVVSAYTRFTATLNSIAGFYNMQLFYNQYFRESFLGFLSHDDHNTVVRLDYYRQLYSSRGFPPDQASALANSAIGQVLAQQSQLLTIRAVFMTMAILLSAIALLVLVLPAIRRTYPHWNKRMFVWPRY